MISAFRRLNDIPGKKTGTGGVICLAKERLPLTDAAWTLPVYMI
jgi:hypothetical protein